MIPFNAILTSKKFWYTLIGVAALLFGEKVGLTQDQAIQVAGMFGVLTAGQAVADHGKEKEKIIINAKDE